jgi:hypothetical protein
MCEQAHLSDALLFLVESSVAKIILSTLQEVGRLKWKFEINERYFFGFQVLFGSAN